MPAHASFGWDWGDEAEGELERNMVVCQQKEWADGNWSLAAEPPSGQLNPINDRVYEVSHHFIGYRMLRQFEFRMIIIYYCESYNFSPNRSNYWLLMLLYVSCLL